MTILAFASKITGLILSKRIRLLCAKCGKEWRGGHECEGKEDDPHGSMGRNRHREEYP